MFDEQMQFRSIIVFSKMDLFDAKFGKNKYNYTVQVDLGVITTDR